VIHVERVELAAVQDEDGGNLIDITDSESGRIFKLKVLALKEVQILLSIFDFRAAARRRWKRWYGTVRLANAFKQSGQDRLERLRDPIFEAGFSTYQDTPEEFYCPITCVLLQDPVIAADGITYERDAIFKWLQQSRISPCLNTQLESMELTPNVALRELIHHFATKGRGKRESLAHLWNKTVMRRNQVAEKQVICGIRAAGSGVGVVPSSFIGPTTGLLLRDPVVAADGVTYEREALLRLMGRLGDYGPGRLQLRPNTTLRKLIESTAESGRSAYQRAEAAGAAGPIGSKRQ
jgi:hypothetical protein